MKTQVKKEEQQEKVETNKMSGSSMLIKALALEGVDIIFGYIFRRHLNKSDPIRD